MEDNPESYYARAFNRSEIEAIQAQAIKEQNRRAAFERMARVIAWAVATGLSWALIMAVGVAIFNFYFF